MTFEEKTKEYRDQITSLKEIDSLEVYQWLISLGKKLNENPLSKEKQTQENKVVRCQYDLYVDKEDDTFKAVDLRNTLAAQAHKMATIKAEMTTALGGSDNSNTTD